MAHIVHLYLLFYLLRGGFGVFLSIYILIHFPTGLAVLSYCRTLGFKHRVTKAAELAFWVRLPFPDMKL